MADFQADMERIRQDATQVLLTQGGSIDTAVAKLDAAVAGMRVEFQTMRDRFAEDTAGLSGGF